MKGRLFAVATCLLTADCAPVGSANLGPTASPKPAEVIERSAASTPPIQPAQLLDSRPAPPIADCEAWKEIDRKVYRAPLIKKAENDVIGDTIDQVYRAGWPEDAAKQLLVVLMGAYSDQGMTEDQFVASQFERCKREASKPGPKYPNVTVSNYWSQEKKAAAAEQFDRTQGEYARRQQMLGPCLQYRAQASMVPLYKNKGISIEDATANVTSAAYGPGGIAYRGSQETESLLARLVAAGYTLAPSTWRNEQGQPTNDFGEYAFARCIKGNPF